MTWSLPLDRMRVNAALTVLTEQFDPIAARDVIVAFHGLPADSQFRSEWWASTKGGARHTGATPEHGNVTINDDKPAVVKSGGPTHPERVGQFKVFRVRIGERADITFRPFWASDETTAVDPTCEWHLHYRFSDFEPIALLRYDWQLIEAPWWNHLEALWRMLRLGRVVRTRFWSPVGTTLFLAEGYEVS
jgi:hypothetical protein